MDLTAPPSTTGTVPNAPASPTSLTTEQDKVTSTNSAATNSTGTGAKSSGGPMVWPAWVYCTRYSDRPSSGKSAGRFICLSFVQVIPVLPNKNVIYCGALATGSENASSRFNSIFSFNLSMPAMFIEVDGVGAVLTYKYKITNYSAYHPSLYIPTTAS